MTYGQRRGMEGEEKKNERERGGREKQDQVGPFPDPLSLPPLSSWPRAEPCLGAAAGMSPLPTPGFWDPGVLYVCGLNDSCPHRTVSSLGLQCLAPSSHWGHAGSPLSHLMLMRCQAGALQGSPTASSSHPLNHCGLEPESWLGRRRESYCSPELPGAKAVILPAGGGGPGGGAWTLAGGGGARATAASKGFPGTHCRGR